MISAAEACFSESGYRVSLEEIAERAGVGRGTLYRNFKDRMALVLAIFDREVERIEASFDHSLPLDRAIMQIVTGGARASSLLARLSADLPLAEDSVAAFEALGERLIRLLEPMVAREHAAGTLRRDVGARQIVLASRMVASLLNSKRHKAEDEIQQALAMLLTGLRPR